MYTGGFRWYLRNKTRMNVGLLNPLCSVSQEHDTGDLENPSDDEMPDVSRPLQKGFC